MKVEYFDISELDRKEYKFSDVLNDMTKIIVTDDNGNAGYTFIKNSEIELFGKDYIESHVSVSYSKVLNEWFVNLNRDDYYNDLNHNPLRPVRVEFIEIERGTGREVYRGIINRRFYLREVHPEQNFARWFVCGTKRKIDDGTEARTNLLFICGNQKEQVKYHDGRVAAWYDTYNPIFFNHLF